ncbi:hypothetical protein L596_019508 [Steinernema carpocapsae]|uniref:Uncharacterized protein n=1 Tax=Steinernema carpocapsae TaxID=34508 RepID=A0A4U5MQQ9_STECR|nr:hypothetical protein L596_019508 [Steinernema carpocapsae]
MFTGSTTSFRFPKSTFENLKVLFWLFRFDGLDLTNGSTKLSIIHHEEQTAHEKIPKLGNFMTVKKAKAFPSMSNKYIWHENVLYMSTKFSVEYERDETLAYFDFEKSPSNAAVYFMNRTNIDILCEEGKKYDHFGDQFFNLPKAALKSKWTSLLSVNDGVKLLSRSRSTKTEEELHTEAPLVPETTARETEAPGNSTTPQAESSSLTAATTETSAKKKREAKGNEKDDKAEEACRDYAIQKDDGEICTYQQNLCDQTLIMVWHECLIE